MILTPVLARPKHSLADLQTGGLLISPTQEIPPFSPKHSYGLPTFSSAGTPTHTDSLFTPTRARVYPPFHSLVIFLHGMHSRSNERIFTGTQVGVFPPSHCHQNYPPNHIESIACLPTQPEVLCQSVRYFNRSSQHTMGLEKKTRFPAWQISNQ